MTMYHVFLELRFIDGGYWHIYYNFFLQENRAIILIKGKYEENDNSMRRRIDIGKNDRNK